MTFAGGITLPSKELYGHSNSKSASAFFKYFSSVVSLLNEGIDDRPNNAREIRDVIDFERQLAGIMAREDNMTGMFVTIDKVGWSIRRGSNMYWRESFFISNLQVDIWAPLGPEWGSWQDFFNDVIADFFEEQDDEEVIRIEKDTRVMLPHRSCNIFDWCTRAIVDLGAELLSP